MPFREHTEMKMLIKNKIIEVQNVQISISEWVNETMIIGLYLSKI